MSNGHKTSAIVRPKQAVRRVQSNDHTRLSDFTRPIEKGKQLDKDPGKKAWFEQTYQSRMMASMGKMVPLMDKCKDNQALLKVFSSME